MKPIIFGTDSVQAILDGRKTMTRRVIKPQPTNPRWNNIGWSGWDDGHGYKMRQPYQPGDILWVRETWQRNNLWYADNDYDGYMCVVYKADEHSENIFLPHDDFERHWNNMSGSEPDWHPSIYMPREAARLFLRVTDVRVERLQDISEADAVREGCRMPRLGEHVHEGMDLRMIVTAQDAFTVLWDRINGKRDGGAYAWDKNPWVWVLSFERIEKPEGV